jgi:hypothetical protein
MIVFQEIGDSDPALAYSPLVRAIEKTFSHIAEHGGIGLTTSKTFKRYFVHWAPAEFAWPGYSEREV